MEVYYQDFVHVYQNVVLFYHNDVVLVRNIICAQYHRLNLSPPLYLGLDLGKHTQCLDQTVLKALRLA